MKPYYLHRNYEGVCKTLRPQHHSGVSPKHHFYQISFLIPGEAVSPKPTWKTCGFWLL